MFVGFCSAPAARCRRRKAAWSCHAAALFPCPHRLRFAPEPFRYAELATGEMAPRLRERKTRVGASPLHPFYRRSSIGAEKRRQPHMNLH